MKRIRHISIPYNTSIAEFTRIQAAYRAGLSSHWKKLSQEDCPFTTRQSVQRRWWLRGWEDEFNRLAAQKSS